ncbi:MAG: hypothetical protein CM1200mP18_15580 [Gammaproteobacteria bacterium]|nr:MAG: hypothetical protein CM1200mP18_15580 [Gammaproteobacteria bacterium]
MNESVKNVSFIGLGVMGYPMAGHLSKAGYSVRVYNRSKDKASKWVEEHGAPGGYAGRSCQWGGRCFCLRW